MHPRQKSQIHPNNSYLKLLFFILKVQFLALKQVGQNQDMPKSKNSMFFKIK
jgi:hypothetical protein